MAIQQVSGPSALPAEGSHTIYIISLAEPRYIISGKQGAVYEREDGEAWEGDGYHVELSFEGKTTHRPAHRIIEGKK